MKALASIPIFVYILFGLPNSSDSCCCDFWGHTCYCNIFRCNCAECGKCPPTEDGYCHYQNEHLDCTKSNEKACARFWSSSRVKIPDIN